VFDGLVATCPNAPATVKGSQPLVLPAWPVGHDLLTLPLAQRLELVQTLWDSIAMGQVGSELTDADRRPWAGCPGAVALSMLLRLRSEAKCVS
jgi:hypothetical protein